MGELKQVLDILPGQPKMQQVTSQLGSSQMRLGSEKPQADKQIVCQMPIAVPDLSKLQHVKPVELIIYYPRI
jgi:hypothetical protein